MVFLSLAFLLWNYFVLNSGMWPNVHFRPLIPVPIQLHLTSSQRPICSTVYVNHLRWVSPSTLNITSDYIYLLSHYRRLSYALHCMTVVSFSVNHSINSINLSIKRYSSAGIFKQPIGTRNRVGISLSYRPARLRRLAALVSCNRFLVSFKSLKIRAK